MNLFYHQVLKKIIIKLFVSSAVLWTAWAASSSIQPTSRRLANLPYVLLVLTLSTILILLLLIVDVLGGLYNKVITLEYFNNNQLLVFLIANLLTGMVNSCIRTLYTSPIIAFIVLVSYSTTVCGVAWIIEQRPWIYRPESSS